MAFLPKRTVVLARISEGIRLVGTPGVIPLNVAYLFTFKVAGGSGKFVFVESGALPTGITFADLGNGTATLSGTTTATGSYPITVVVYDTNGYQDKQTFILEVKPLVLQIGQTQQIYRNTAVGAGVITLFATGGSGGGYTYSVVSGGVAGMSINAATGAYTGTPTTIGTFTPTFRVVDGGGNATNAVLQVVVNSRLVPSPAGIVATEQGLVLSQNIAVTNAITGAVIAGTLSFTAAGPTNGISINTAGHVSGTVTGPGAVTLTTTITDSATGDTLIFGYRFTALPQFSVVTSAFPTNNVVGVPLVNAQLSVTGGGEAPYAWVGVGLPSWVTLTAVANASGVMGVLCNVTGTPPIGTYTLYTNSVTLNFNITDNRGRVIAGSVTFNVNQPGALQPQQGGVNQGSTGSLTFNFVGPTVTNSAGVVTVTLPIQSVGVTTPLQSTGGANPTLSILQAGSAQNGYLSSTDWNTFNGKQAGDADLTAIAALATTGWAQRTGTNTWVLSDPVSANLHALDALGTTGVAKRTGSNTWGLISGTTAQVILGDGSLGTLPGAVVTTITTSVTIAQAAWNVVFVNANALTPVLPAAPNIGDEIDFVIAAGVTSLTINPNSLKIETTTGNMTCNLFKPNGSVANFTMIYTNATEGWTIL
jgi:hypothetical protein